MERWTHESLQAISVDRRPFLDEASLTPAPQFVRRLVVLLLLMVLAYALLLAVSASLGTAPQRWPEPWCRPFICDRG
jgi:hypothetical protein